MPSPFPGMDPYLEDSAVWADFHTTYLTHLRAALNRLLPQSFVAHLDRHVWIDEPEELRLLGKPDIFVTDPLNFRSPSAATLLWSAPATATLPAIDVEGKLYLKILDGRGRRVVTVIELLSPANKSPGRGREPYLAKRLEYFRTGTNLIEIDLLRGGERPPLESGRSHSDYFILVSQATKYPEAGVWPLSVRDPLPTIPVPLDPSTAPASLPLRPSLDLSYDDARLDTEIDYTQPPSPQFSGLDADWVRELIAARTA